MPPIPKGSIKVAILDDYQGIAAGIFASSSLPNGTLKIDSYADTIPAYNHPTTTSEQKKSLVERLKPYYIISAMRERTPFPAELLENLPNLRLLMSTGGRNRGIDMEAARKLGIVVTGTGVSPSASVPTKNDKPKGPDNTTQHAIALVMGITHNLASDDANVRNGGWQSSFTTSLTGKTFCTLGLGRLGSAVAKIMHQSFGMRILAWSENLTQERADAEATRVGLPIEGDGENTFKVVSKEEIFKRADVLSVHLVLSERTTHLVGAKELSLMKPTSFLINTSRGPIVDESALQDSLERGSIKGTALDVFEFEPLPLDSKWRTTKWGQEGRGKVLLSPHMGYGEEESIRAWYVEQVRTVERWVEGQEGKLVNVIN